MGEQQLQESAMPAWVLPVTGRLNVPIVGNYLHFSGEHELCLMFFGIGIIFIFILMAIIISRLFFRSPMAAVAQPSLMILSAPFALAFSGYEGLSGVQDIAASAFFYFTMFLLLLFGSKVLLLPKTCPFQVSWWSVSFPLASVTIACLRYARNGSHPIHWIAGASLLAVTTLVVVYLLLLTTYQLWTGELAPRIGVTT